MSVDISLLLECRFGGTLLLCTFYNNDNLLLTNLLLYDIIKKIIPMEENNADKYRKENEKFSNSQ